MQVRRTIENSAAFTDLATPVLTGSTSAQVLANATSTLWSAVPPEPSWLEPMTVFSCCLAGATPGDPPLFRGKQFLPHDHRVAIKLMFPNAEQTLVKSFTFTQLNTKGK